LDKIASIGRYFSLLQTTAVFGGAGSESKSQVGLFVGVLLGALSKVVFDALSKRAAINWGDFVLATIASFVVFPQLYYSGGLSKKKVSFAHWTFAFQNGFFWSVALDALTKKFHL
jgi:hypothetical protein